MSVYKMNAYMEKLVIEQGEAIDEECDNEPGEYRGSQHEVVHCHPLRLEYEHLYGKLLLFA
jgi:hypothetical protein